MTDEEYLCQLSKVEIYCEILLGILRYTNVKIYSSEEEQIKELTKKLKFQNSYDFDLFRACIDQMEDAQYAINEFTENGLFLKNEKHSEMYLRLYGVLNACYLQIGVLTDLIRLFNFKSQKEIRKILNKLKVIELRNKIASHTTNYINENKKISYYKLSQSSLSKKADNLLIVGKDESFHVDLSECVTEFTITIEYYLDQIIDKELYSRKFKKEAFEWMRFRHEFIKKT